MRYFRQLSQSFVMLGLLTFILAIGFSGIALADEKAAEEKAPAAAEETAPAAAEETAPAAAEETAPAAAEETAPAAAEEKAPAAE